MFNIYSTTNYTEFTNLDLFLEEIIGLRKNGRFLEIGAFDGETNSKTAQLADLGWQGIYVEPIEEYRKKCAERHRDNNVEILPYAIANRSEVTVMHKGGLPSTLKVDHRDHIQAFTEQKKYKLDFTTEKVQTFTWEKLIHLHAPFVPDLLVIDAEGVDLDIVRSIRFEEYRPSIICCEVFPKSAAFVHPSVIEDGKEIIRILLANGYHIWLQESHNILFSTKRIPKIFEEIDDSYQRLSALKARQPDAGNLEFIKDLIKTRIIQGDLKEYSYLLDFYKSSMTKEVGDAEVNILALGYYYTGDETKALDILKQYSTADSTNESRLLLDFLFSQNQRPFSNETIVQLIDRYPQRLEYTAFRKLHLSL